MPSGRGKSRRREPLSESGARRRSPRAAAWLEAGLIDLEFYSALRGRSFPDGLVAAEDFVDWGMRRRLSSHPQLDFVSLPAEVRAAWRQGRAEEVLAFLSREGQPLWHGPLGDIDDVASAREHMIAAARELSQGATENRGEPGPAALNRLTETTGQNVDWEALRAAMASRVHGLTSVVIPSHADARKTIRAVHAIRRRAQEAEQDVEVIVVHEALPAHHFLALVAVCYTETNARLVRLSEQGPIAAQYNAGFSHTNGDVVVFLDADAEVRRGWLSPLRARLGDPEVAGTQSLLLDADDTIWSAGTVFLDSDLLPCHFMPGHPKEDATAIDGEGFPAVSSAALALRVEDVIRLRGFDSAYRSAYHDVDLCLRLLPFRAGGFRVASQSLVSLSGRTSSTRRESELEDRRLFAERWSGRFPGPDPGVYRRSGFELAAVGSDDSPVPAALPRLGGRSRAHPGRLRWSIKLPSTPGHWGDDWGDTHFADALARALRGLGQDVVTCRRGARDTATAHLDDVSLAIRGLYPIAPVLGKFNILWVISHPEMVEPAELEGFDLVYAASIPWSHDMTARSGRDVRPLLQATDLHAAHTPSGHEPALPEAVFVGNANNGRERPIVNWAIDAGLPLAVYGRGWEGRLPDGVLRADYVDPGRLPALYRRHALVLADHWPDMAKHGFIANRVFDAIAMGTPVACDLVRGIDEVFGPEVQVVRDAEDLRRLHKACPTLNIAESTGLGDAAERLRRQHSFNDRADVLWAMVKSLAG